MRPVYLKQPYAEATLNVAPWYLRVCSDQYKGRELTRDQTFVRDVVETASNITTRAVLYDFLKSQRVYPMRDMQVSDPLLHRFVKADLNPENMCKLGWDEFAHYSASLPFKYVRALSPGRAPRHEREQKLVNHTLVAMSAFPLKMVFKSYAMIGLYFYQKFDPQLCTAFESSTPVPMATAFSSLAQDYAWEKRFELLAAAMMIASADGYLDAARRARKDATMQKSHTSDALRSFGLATVFSFRVRENAHCFSPVILDTLQSYAGYMQGSIKRSIAASLEEL